MSKQDEAFEAWWEQKRCPEHPHVIEEDIARNAFAAGREAERKRVLSILNAEYEGDWVDADRVMERIATRIKEQEK